jgi:hypothetical protein
MKSDRLLDMRLHPGVGAVARRDRGRLTALHKMDRERTPMRSRTRPVRERIGLIIAGVSMMGRHET